MPIEEFNDHSPEARRQNALFRASVSVHFQPWEKLASWLFPRRRVSWEAIPLGQIFLGAGYVAPRNFPPDVSSCGYGIVGPWYKSGERQLFDCSSGSRWDDVESTDSSWTWFEWYRPLCRVKFRRKA